MIQDEDIWIDNRHKVFKNTEYQDTSFKVLIKLTESLSEKIKAQQNDIASIVDLIFIEGIEDWTIKDAQGNPLRCSIEVRKLVKQLIPDFVNLIVAAFLDMFSSKVIDSVKKQFENLAPQEKEIFKSPIKEL